jgi:8-oxo-dGTP pyrophosphatase MutT (NUDIX family)
MHANIKARLRLNPQPECHFSSLGDLSSKTSVVGMIFTKNQQLVFIRRSPYLKHHPHQIAFPGGYVEPQDRSFLQTMLRELGEELLLSSSDLDAFECWGYLPTATSLRQFPVVPLVGYLPQIVDPSQFNSHEVSSVHLLDWRLFLAEKREDFKFNILGQWRQSSLYRTPDVSVWGLTARLIETAFR